MDVSAQLRQNVRTVAVEGKVRRSLASLGIVLPWLPKRHVPCLPAALPPGAAMQLLQRSVIYDQRLQTMDRREWTREAGGATNQNPA